MWISPTGHTDVDNAWTNEANAYDGAQATSALRGYGGSSSDFLELNLAEAISCDKLRFYVGTQINLINVDVYYEDAWHDVFLGDPVGGQWEEKTISGGPKNISKARLGINSTGQPDSFTLYEFEFNVFEITPAGDRGKAMLNLRQLIAESATFQAAVGATTGDASKKADDAKFHIHITAYTPENADFTRPFALICKTENDKEQNIATNTFAIGGDLELRIEAAIPAAYRDDPKNAEWNFLNFVETVLAEIKALSAMPGYFAINNITCIEGPTQYESAAGTFVYGVRLMVGWGLS